MRRDEILENSLGNLSKKVFFSRKISVSTKEFKRRILYLRKIDLYYNINLLNEKQVNE